MSIRVSRHRAEDIAIKAVAGLMLALAVAVAARACGPVPVRDAIDRFASKARAMLAAR